MSRAHTQIVSPHKPVCERVRVHEFACRLAGAGRYEIFSGRSVPRGAEGGFWIFKVRNELVTCRGGHVFARRSALGDACPSFS